MNKILLWMLLLFPLCGAVVSYLTGRKNKKLRDKVVMAVTLIEAMGAAGLLISELGGMSSTSTGVEYVLGLGIHFMTDGFRVTYLLVACLLWFACSVFSAEYMGHERNRNRYYFFWLTTLSFVVGVLLSADLFTTFLFFELMSFTSFVWVIQAEKEDSLHAGKLYLGIGVISGLVMLMGILLSYFGQAGDVLTSALICVGFAAKAGLFLLHVWLPKAHTVAPAPASAILSGILTKMGIFGILIVTGSRMLHNEIWGLSLLFIGIATMFTGAFLALFSVNFKRTLACSSVSQMGFIITGISMYTLLHETTLAINGTFLHMLNHSLIKLVLFLTAGVIFMKTESLDLNEIRGYGKNKPLLHAAFFVGAYSIAGIPLGSGYVSKTLIHESMVEYMHELGESSLLPFVEAAEVLFLITGGMTLAYMLKLYIAVFVENGKAKEEPMCKTGSLLCVAVPAVVLAVLGLLPNLTMDAIAGFARLTEAPVVESHHWPVHYFTWTNLKGAVISISIGVTLYFGFIRTCLMKKENGVRVYVNLLPEWLDLEKNVYQPVVLGLLPFIGGLFCRLLDKMTDFFTFLLRKNVFKPKKKHHPVVVGNELTYVLGSFLDGVVRCLNATFLRKRPIKKSYVEQLAIRTMEVEATILLVGRSVSFGLLLFGIGLIVTLLYLLF